MNVTEESTENAAPSLSGAGGRPKPLSRRHRRRSPKWLRRLGRNVNLRAVVLRVLLALVLVATVIGVGGLVLATDASSRVASSFATLNRVISSTFNQPGTDLTLEDFTRLRSSIRDVIVTLTGVQQQAGLARPVLSLNQDMRVTLTYLDAAQQLALSADAMLEGMQPMLFFLVGGEDQSTVVTQISSGERIVELLRIGRPSFLNAEIHLNSAAQIIGSIDPGTLSAQMLLQLEELRGFELQLRNIQSLLMSAPDLLQTALGLNQEQSYLVLSQNSDEIRPSGGFLSTYGWFVVRNGRVVEYNYSESTATNPNPPPSATADQIQIPDWWLQYEQPVYAAWDGNWSPDFPSAANRAMWFYNNGNNPQSPVGGVIAIDIVAFEYILEALGEVTVPGFDQTITPQNFRDVVYTIRAGGEASSEHKRFLAAVYRQIFEDWQSLTNDPDRNTALLGLLLQALREKHIMIYSSDATMNQAFGLLGWSGRQEEAVGRDYLMVVDTNLGNKSNSSIRRQLTYDVEIAPEGSTSSRLTINYDYSDAVASLDPAVNPESHGPLNYNNLLQVYLPVNSQLTEQVGNFVNLRQHPSTTNTLLTALLSVPYNSSERFQIAYNALGVIETIGDYQRYQLLIQKQPGMRAELVNLQISLPPGAVAVSVTPAPATGYSIDRQILEFRLDLLGDTEVEIVYQAASPPS